MPKVHFPHENVTIEVPYGTNLRRAALDNGVDVYGFPFKFLNCGGHGLCGTCKVAVEPEHNVSERTNAEDRKLKAAPLRLSCQCSVEGDIDCITQIPLETMTDVQRMPCYIIVSRPRLEMVQVVEGNAHQRNVFLDRDEVEAVAREVAALYPDGNWEIRAFDDPLTTQEFSFSYNLLRYTRPRHDELLADGADNLTAQPVGAAPAQQPRLVGDVDPPTAPLR